MVRTMEKAAIAAGYSIIVCNTDDDAERELAVLDQLRAQHVAGIVLTPSDAAPTTSSCSSAHNLPPIVTIDNKVPGLARDFVGVDNRAAARMLTEYLLRLGHRRIAMITGRPGCGRRKSGSPASSRPWRPRAFRSIPACALPATIAATPPTRRPCR